MVLIQAAPTLSEFDYMTGDQEESVRTRAAVLQLLSLRNKTECSEAFEGFNERSMFITPGQEKLRDTMKEKFRNVSAILDCIACESCRMQVRAPPTQSAALMPSSLKNCTRRSSRSLASASPFAFFSLIRFTPQRLCMFSCACFKFTFTLSATFAWSATTSLPW
jgi:hypothetical protein